MQWLKLYVCKTGSLFLSPVLREEGHVNMVKLNVWPKLLFSYGRKILNVYWLLETYLFKLAVYRIATYTLNISS